MSSAESSAKLPDVIDPTVAVDSVRSQRESLLNMISHCLSSLANSLLAKSIIPQDIYKKVCNPFLEESVKGGALLDCVETRIGQEASDFATFIDILKSEPFLRDQAKKLVKNYNNNLSIPPAKRPAIITPAISQYAAYLKGVYKTSPISSDSKWPPTPSKEYISLATVTYGYKYRDRFIGEILQGNVNEALTSRKKISVEKILVPDEEGVAYLKLVLIEGAPGIGKSTLAWKLCRRWEQGCMEKYNLTILLRLREKEVQNITNIPELFSENREIMKKEISSSNGKGVLFILDGFDELPTTLQKEGFLVNLIKGTFLPECTVVVTSRPSATAELLTICRPQIQKRIEILGFTQESVEEYATSIFSSEPERLEKFKAFISASKNPAINSLMYVPLNAAIIVEIYRDSKSDHLLPHTLTQVYTQLCLTILNRYLQTRISQFKDLPSHLYQEFLKLLEIAFNGMKKHEVIFHALPSDLVHFGFLDAVYSLYGGGNASYNFLHLTVQEFFAAYHISQLNNDDARLALLRDCGSDSQWNVVWRFVAGLTQFEFFKGHLNSDIFVKKNNGNEALVKSLFVQCLFEANIKMDESKLFGPKNIMMHHYSESTTQTPLDWYVLGYCIANLTSGVSWNVNVKGSNSINNLVSGLKTSNSISNSNIINKLYISCKDKSEDLSCLEHFPLCGIMVLNLFGYSFTSSDHLTKLLPSMKSLKRLVIQFNTFSNPQFADKLLQQLSQTSVTSLDARGTDLSQSTSALKHLIDPRTGTMDELCVGKFTSDSLSDDEPFSDDRASLILDDSSSEDAALLDDRALSDATENIALLDDTLILDDSSSDEAALPDDTSFIHHDPSVLEVVCATSSLKSLKLINPRDIASLAKLRTNAGLIKLEIEFQHYSYVSEVIVEIIKHNKTLEHLIVEMPWNIGVIWGIVKALPRNSTLKTIEIRYCNNVTRYGYSYVSEYMEAEFPSKNYDPRIKWHEVITTEDKRCNSLC